MHFPAVQRFRGAESGWQRWIEDGSGAAYRGVLTKVTTGPPVIAVGY